MPEKTLRINEIFFSIQGESTRAGMPCVFVRLTGCHLRCHYCDTEYAFREGGSRSVDEIVDDVCSHPSELVEITGGEPLNQKFVGDLITSLCDLGKTVLIETSGACDISVCDPRSIRIMDIKTPGSGEVEKNLWANIDLLTERDEVKFVICDREDFDWARDVILKHELARKCGAVLFSPVFEQAAGLEIAGCPGLSPRDLAQWMLEDRELAGIVRMQTQLHKQIWDPQMRGV
ncbi:MAG: radical SAM protein [Planctomycetes bacterium]|nr:radical SAM protein [Planctomycetota bacterium]